jgi:type II secretory pathway pseudopilin PulG
LLIVVAIILMIAAIAIPNLLRSRMAANQASAVGSLRTMSQGGSLQSQGFDVGQGRIRQQGRAESVTFWFSVLATSTGIERLALSSTRNLWKREG